MRKYLYLVCFAIIALLATFQPVFAADEGMLGNNRWAVQSDGDIVPQTDSSYDVGASGAEVGNIYADSLWLGGVEYTSLATGSDGNWTNTGLTLTADAAPTKFIATFSSGDFYATGFTVGTGDFTFAQGAKLDGDTNGTVKIIEASDTLSIIFTGSTIQLDSSDGGFQFGLTDGSEGQVDFLCNNDTNDYMSISTASNVPTITTSGTSNLAIVPDGGTVDVTGAVTASGLVTGAGLTTSTTITLQNSETIVNSTNNTVEVGGGTNTVLSILDTGTSDSDSSLLLRADASADNGDDWMLTSDGATNSLLFQNDTGGSQATILTLANSGVTTLTGALTLSNGETITNATDTAVRVTASGGANTVLDIYSSGTSNGTATLNLIGDAQTDVTDSFQIKNNANGTLTFGNDSAVAGTYVTVLTLSSAGILTLADSETLTDSGDVLTLTGDDNDTAFAVLGFEAKEARLRLNADQDDDATDGWEIASSVAGTLTIGNDSSAAGTYLDKLTLSSAGVITLVDSETITNASDVVTFDFDDAAASVVISGFEANASALTIQSDQGDDAADKFIISMSAADALTMTTGATEAISIATTGTSTLAAATITGAFAANGTVGLGNNIADIVTVTGKVAGATPLSFDGNTADAVYTIFAMDDPASTSKTITFPAVTGTVQLSSAAVALTPGSAVTLTVAKGTTLYTDTPTDNEDQTITFSGAGAAGDEVTIIFTCVGTADEIITFHSTLVSSIGTLTCDTTAARYYVVRFISNGSHWFEVSRTAVQT